MGDTKPEREWRLGQKRASAETTRWWSLPVRLHQCINEARYEQADGILHNGDISERNMTQPLHNRHSAEIPTITYTH